MPAPVKLSYIFGQNKTAIFSQIFCIVSAEGVAFSDNLPIPITL